MFKSFTKHRSLSQGHPAGQCIACFKSLVEGLDLYELFTTNDILCSECRSKLRPCKKTINVDGLSVYALYWYNEGMSELMHRIKELYDESLVKVFHNDLRYYLAWKYRKCYKVCVPSSEMKTQERGFHAVQRMYEPWSVQDAFVKEDVKQSLKSALDRRLIANAIKLKDPSIRKHRKILLVDDVCTTGSSLKACHDLLKNEENTVSIVVLALHTSWDQKGSLTIKKK